MLKQWPMCSYGTRTWRLQSAALWWADRKIRVTEEGRWLVFLFPPPPQLILPLTLVFSPLFFFLLTPKPGNICNLIHGQGRMFTKSLRPLLDSLEWGNQEAWQNLLVLRYGVETFLGQARTVYILKDSPCFPAAVLICHVVRSSLIGYWACCGHFYGFRAQSESCQSMGQSV